MDTTSIIINELTQGMESAMELNSIILSSNFSSKTEHFLIQQIISSYDRALLMVNSGGQTLSQPEESSIVYLDESPRSQDATQDFDDQQEEKVVSEKKRKLAMPTWRNQIRISTENGFEGNTDDGYNWRKYGQKDILGSQFPRSYYRCTYRYVQLCMARKQVQRTNDPTVFEITYKGKHTCNHQPPSPPKNNLIATTSDMDLDAATVVPSSSFSFPPASFENYQQSHHFLNETEEYSSVLQGYPRNFSSPGSNYFQRLQDEYSNPSAAASGSNYPQLDRLSQDFAFNNPGYFNI